MSIENNNTIWTFLKREIWLIGIVISAVLAIYIPMSQVKQEVVLQNQKLDTLIKWTQKHEEETVKNNQQLNEVFADIYEKLGSKFINR